MIEQPRVETAKDNGEKRQWIKLLLFKLEGSKSVLIPKRLFTIVSLGLLIPIICVLFQPAPPEKVSSEFQENGSQPVNQFVDLPALKERIETGLTGKSRSSKPLRFLGPTLVARPFGESLLTGHMAKGILASGASDGPVRAELTEPLIINGEVIAEQGSALLGYGRSTEERLTIQFTKLILKDGSQQTINAQAIDGNDKIAGLKGSKVAKTALKVAGSIGLGFIGGMAEGLQDSQVENGMEIKKPSLRNAALRGTSQAALDQSKNLMNSLNNERPIIEVAAGTPIYIIFEPPKTKGDTGEQY